VDYDYVVIGGGIYGCWVALKLAQRGRVVIVEQQPDLLCRASFHNQARVHGGYHYPRSLLTALRSRINAPKFIEEFREAICFDHDHYYAVSRQRSNVTPGQFERFCRRIGAEIAPAPLGVRKHFNEDLVEAVFKVREYAFNAERLRDCLKSRLADQGIDVLAEHEALKIVRSSGDGLLTVEARDKRSGLPVALRGTQVYNCTYSRLNEVLARSGLQPIRLSYEATEMALVEVPASLSNMCFTVVCGPFFSLMPFPPASLMVLTHVSYTPHYNWADGAREDDCAAHLPSFPLPTQFERMRRDAARYVPALRDCRHVRSLWEVKTLLPQSDLSDSRPILFKRDGLEPNVVSVLGGKVDNVFDLEGLL
jgi:glycine/D-amino acid oxidase-like deaminating enzyme